eukprot:jgi/Astpho2/9435/Aster-01694
MGLVASFKWGRGLLLTKHDKADEDAADGILWSAAAFYKIHSASLGLSAGVDHVQTLLILGTQKAVDAFRYSGKGGTLVLGTDFTVAAMAGGDLGLGSSESSNPFLDRDAISLSLSDGAMLDLSLAGGSITPDTKLNSRLYGNSGQNMSPRQIVDGTAAAEDRAQPALLPLYKLLQQIQASAKDDPRSFDGFVRHWEPQSIFQSGSPSKDKTERHAHASSPSSVVPV